MQPKNTVCLTFRHGAEEAARFYTGLFPDSQLGSIQYAPSDYPGGKQGDALAAGVEVARRAFAGSLILLPASSPAAGRPPAETCARCG